MKAHGKHWKQAIRVCFFTLLLLPSLALALCISSYSFRDSIYFSTPVWGGVICSSAGRLVHGGAIWTRPQPWRIERQAIPLPAMDRREPLFLANVASHGRTWELHVPHLFFVVLVTLAAVAGTGLGLRRLSGAEPCAAPNGGPATRLGDSNVTEGPPSVS